MTPRSTDGTDGTVEAGNFRFSILTDRLIRVEYCDDAVFEDRPTLDVANRSFEPVEYEVVERPEGLVIDTGALRIVCGDVVGPPTPETLSASIDREEGPIRWRYGDPTTDDLGGTVRTLDMWRGDSLQRVTGHDPDSGFIREWDPQPLGPGFLTRSGWVVFDDSNSVVLGELPTQSSDPSPNPRHQPVRRDPGHHVDIYLFGHGDDHRGALQDANLLIGPRPLPPRWAFGYWYSRYFPYTDDDLVELVDELDRNAIPVDVLVIDMDWHRPGWTGYSWDRDLYEDPTATLDLLHDRGLRVTLNLHPADGVASHEDAFWAMCEAMGLDPSTTDHIPFDPTDPTFVESYFTVLHHPEEDRGVDFWWLDWQQGDESVMPGLDPLAWLNHLHWEDQMRRPDRRPLNFSRWDGPGAARRPIGFSGDTFATWESLAYQPFFTATAANVLFGHWSHDIGGHLGGSGDPELYLRWIQFGVHSPVLRTHGSLDIVEERRIWEYPNPYRAAMIAAVRRRYELIPYIYTSCARGRSQGLSLVRPMYHDHPGVGAAYDCGDQYLFGEDMVVSPVVAPSDQNGLTCTRTWLPQGSWYDTVRGRTIHVDVADGRWLAGEYLIDEVPVFVRGGSTVFTQRGVMRNDGAFYPNLHLQVFPGGGGSSVLYEDDGTSNGHLHGQCVELAVHHDLGSAVRSLTLSGAEGDYPGWEPMREVRVTFHSETPPLGVRVDGRSLEWSREPHPDRWSYDASDASVVVELGSVDLRVDSTIVLQRGGVDGAAVDGLPGLIHRLGSIDRDIRVIMGDDSRLLARLARTARRVAADPDTFMAELTALPTDLQRLQRAVAAAIDHWSIGESLEPLSPPRATGALRRALAQLETTIEEYR